MGGIQRLVDRDLVFFVDLVARMGQREGKLSIVGHDEEAFAFLVEPSDVEDTRPAGGKQIVNGAAIEFVIGRNDVAARLVQNGMDRHLRAHDAITHLHNVLGADLRGEIFDEVAIDPHTAALDELLHTSAGAQTSSGEITI